MPADDRGAGAAPAPPAAAAADDDGGGDEEEEEEEEGPWKTKPEFMTRPNSPLKRISRSNKVTRSIAGDDGRKHSSGGQGARDAGGASNELRVHEVHAEGVRR